MMMDDQSDQNDDEDDGDDGDDDDGDDGDDDNACIVSWCRCPINGSREQKIGDHDEDD